MCSLERSSTALPLLAWQVPLFSLFPYQNDDDHHTDDDDDDDDAEDDDDDDDDGDNDDDVNATWQNTVLR